MRRLIILNILLLFSLDCFSQNNIEFHQKDKTQIKIKFINNFENLEITTSKNQKTQVINDLEMSTTDKESHLQTADYNFDGFKDFAVYRTDDGMGVYTIYQIFIYNPNDSQFKELKMPLTANPECGEFCDVKINPKNKTFESSCRGGAKWHTDVWKFDKNKKLILLKN